MRFKESAQSACAYLIRFVIPNQRQPEEPAIARPQRKTVHSKMSVIPNRRKPERNLLFLSTPLHQLLIRFDHFKLMRRSMRMSFAMIQAAVPPLALLIFRDALE